VASPFDTTTKKAASKVIEAANWPIISKKNRRYKFL